MISSWQLAEAAFVHGRKCDFISIFTSQIEQIEPNWTQTNKQVSMNIITILMELLLVVQLSV